MRDPDDPEAPTFWSRVGRAALAAGRVAGVGAGRAAVTVGRAVSDAYHAVDPDVRRHVAELPLVGLTMLVPRDEVIAALADDGRNPVIFVHGLAGHRGNFSPMRRWFALCGRTRTYSVSLSGDVDAMAASLRETISAVLTVNGLGEGARVDLVAHSLGGLVSRAALADPATAARVATLVTLGTPHAGTFAARYADTSLTRSLRPDSDTLRALDAQRPWPGPPALPRLVALWSDADVALLPPGSARFEGAENIELPGFTHFAYLIHPRGWATVFGAL